jgi:hypothetical protein
VLLASVAVHDVFVADAPEPRSNDLSTRRSTTWHAARTPKASDSPATQTIAALRDQLRLNTDPELEARHRAEWPAREATDNLVELIE